MCFEIKSRDSGPRKVLASTSRLKSVLAGDNNMAFEIVKLRRGSGKDWQGMAPKAKGLKA